MKQGLLFLSILIFMGCKKQDPQYAFTQENISKEGLTFEEDSMIAAQPSRNFKASEILLENGETVEEFLKRTDPSSISTWGTRPFSPQGITGDNEILNFNTNLLYEGVKLSQVDNATTGARAFRAPRQDDLEIDYLFLPRPAQIGYAYVYGSGLDSTKRNIPGECALLLFGMDCSSMTSLMLLRAGAIFDRKYGSVELASEEILNSALRASPALKKFDYEYEDKPSSFLSQISSGDIIYFRHLNDDVTFHIGVALIPADKTGIYIYQSNGSDQSKGDPSNRGCELYSNALGRGPRCVPIKEIINWEKGKFKNFRILHLVPKKTVDPLLTGDGVSPPGSNGAWKFTHESTWLTNDKGKKIPIFQKTFNVKNLTVKFNKDYTFSYADSDPDDACAGTFSYFNSGTSVRLSGCELFSKDPISTRILELTATTLRVLFMIPGDGFVQYSELDFAR